MTMSNPPVDINNFLTFEQDYISRYIYLADSKAIWLFSTFTAVLVFFASRIKFSAIAGEENIILAVLIVSIPMLLLAGGAILSADVIRPRTKPNHDGSLVFFGSVSARKDAQTYITNLRASTAEDVQKDRMVHCYNLATVCTRKYLKLNWSIWLGGIGVLLVVLVFVLTELL